MGIHPELANVDLAVYGDLAVGRVLILNNPPVSRRLPQEQTVLSVNALDDVAGTVLADPDLGSSLEAYGRAQTLLMFLLSEGPTFAWAAGGSAAAGKELHDRVGRQVAAAAEALAPGFPAGPYHSFPHILYLVHLFVIYRFRYIASHAER
jgi:hypothetical protein